MSGTKFGVDALGRRYKTVDGKRMAVGDTKTSPAPKQHKQHPYGEYRDPINKLMQRWLKGAKTPDAVKKDISNLLDSKFRLWLKAAAKTSVGKSGRLYAARMILEALRTGTTPTGDKPEDNRLLRKFQDRHGGLKVKPFMAELKRRGIKIDSTKATSAVPPGFGDADASGAQNDDAAILAVVHRFGLDSKHLQVILEHEFGHDVMSSSEQQST